jgi:FixJ family two-component response regulator
MPRNAKIYIVDDDQDFLEFASHLVKPMGAEVETYSWADDFISNYQADGPGCLVLNAWMPGMSGLELQSQLIQANHRIPIIFVTDYSDIRIVVNALKAGAMNVFEKPVKPQELFEEIQKAVRQDEEAWKSRNEDQNLKQEFAPSMPGENDAIKLTIEE